MKKKLSFPQLEDELKQTRMYMTQLAHDIKDSAPEYKETCLEDATEYEIVENPLEYIKMGLVPNGDKTLVRARFPMKTISEHCHAHFESLKIINGLAHFKIQGVDVHLDNDSLISIPADSFHECEFRKETLAYVIVPADFAKSLSSPAS